ncbi:TioE family transcriptional regulator [Lentzea aerocolonigenes]|uniref:TioE family transcriptional regulator n=1 Tax=Lentzea aerocolonigenes TaxID=68170 RepID=UPI0005EC9EEB
MRPIDLAREHSITPQAVRNYETDGLIPPAERTASGYRVYTDLHAAALRAFLGLVPAHGHATAREIMHALNTGRIDAALAAIDRGHAQLQRDRETLKAVAEAITHLTGTPAGEPANSRSAFTIGGLAHRLDVTTATLRNWEDAGIVVPQRSVAGHRTYDAADVRDAELAHLLRRGGYGLEQIAVVVQQVRTAGGTQALSKALDEWRLRLTLRGVAMLEGAHHLAGYLTFLDVPKLPG